MILAAEYIPSPLQLMLVPPFTQSLPPGRSIRRLLLKGRLRPGAAGNWQPAQEASHGAASGTASATLTVATTVAGMTAGM
jgi:hypothetical protein